MKRPSGPRSAAGIALLAALAAPIHLVAADASDHERARSLIREGAPESAATQLETLLVHAAPEAKAPLRADLKRAYEAAIRKAEVAGRTTDADRYRDDLQILEHANRSARPAAVPEPIASRPEPPEPGPTQAEPPAAPTPEAEPKASASDRPRVRPAGNREIVVEADPPSDDRPRSIREDEEAAGSPRPASSPLLPISAASVAPGPPTTIAPRVEGDGRSALDAADDAFRGRRYAEAGRLYEAMARDRTLPDARREPWAYCRCCEVVRRINAGPADADDWAKLRSEIDQIRRLSPKLWYAEYLRNLVAERSAARPRPGRRQVLRGASPDEPPRPSNPSVPTTAARIGRAAADEGAWKVWETTNFRIKHRDEAFAARVAQVAEASRSAHIRRWAGRDDAPRWTPRCEVVLYPTAALFRRETGQGPESPGFSTMAMGAGRVVDRRITLRADNPKLLDAVLPHEVTHVVLADLFTTGQIPRWADEGISVLSEPESEQRTRDDELAEPLASGRLFALKDLMVMDYPQDEHWGLYYAQSVSLTRYLVERGTAVQFVQFVSEARSGDVAAALRKHYGIGSVDELQAGWLDQARGRSRSIAARESDRVAR